AVLVTGGEAAAQVVPVSPPPPLLRLTSRAPYTPQSRSRHVPEARRGEPCGGDRRGEDTQEKEGILPERAEEAKLKAKYPSLGQKPGGSDFLMKRLQKGQKYFDSGDYNMAKAKMKNKQLPSAGPDKNLVTGDHIPTPQDLPQRKSSLVTSKLAGCRHGTAHRATLRQRPTCHN
uniref:Alpha-endosulfine n=1 Tax=Equus caballus TaxID=9796 RepID=A0A9L0R4E0_HORSE